VPAGSGPASFDHTIARVPRWILTLAVAGTSLAGIFFGLPSAGGFLIGSVGAWVNFRVLARAVNSLASTALKSAGKSAEEKPGSGTGVWVFIQFAGLVLGAFVILRYSGFNIPAALCGFLVCPAAVLIEIVYELATLNFQK
jgi:hypothetical protein